MPANKNAMTRYKILDELLSSRYHNYSLDDLTEEVNKRLSNIYPDTNGVVRRTIEKDINYLEYEGPFMADIERYSVMGYNQDKQKSFTKQCLRYAKPSFSIFKKEMTDDEEDLLREALSLLGQFNGLPNLDSLECLRLGLGIRSKSRRIISFSRNPLEKSNLIGELFTVISQQQVVKLSYHQFSDKNTTLETNVHPYMLKEYNRRWYLLAAAESDMKILSFGLERIDKFTPLPSHKFVEYQGDIEEFFDDIIGVTNFAEKNIEHILFWVSDKSKDYVATKPLHDSQKYYRGEKEIGFHEKYQTLQGGAFFSIDCKENYELIRELTSFGKELLVLEPISIQESICKNLSSVIEEYQKMISMR